MYKYKILCEMSDATLYSITINNADEMIEEEEFFEFYQDGELICVLAKRLVFHIDVTKNSN